MRCAKVLKCSLNMKTLWEQPHAIAAWFWHLDHTYFICMMYASLLLWTAWDLKVVKLFFCKICWVCEYLISECATYNVYCLLCNNPIGQRLSVHSCPVRVRSFLCANPYIQVSFALCYFVQLQCINVTSPDIPLWVNQFFLKTMQRIA